MPKVVVGNLDWMSWNLLLAFVPALMSLVLFRSGRGRTGAWWVGAAAFLLLLPNAPYVLTDVVHLLGDIRHTRSDQTVVLWVLPQYSLFFTLGFGCYVVAIWRVTTYVRAAAGRALAFAVEIGLHGMCAVGIFLGRFLRLNSWDVLSDPEIVARRVHGQIGNNFSVAAITLTFVVISVGASALRWFFAIRVRELVAE